MRKPKKCKSVSGVSITSINDRRLRAAAAKIRPKFEKLAGMDLTAPSEHSGKLWKVIYCKLEQATLLILPFLICMTS